jgi:TonB family protein
MMILFLTAGVCAQSTGSETNHFAADQISFDYPAGFSVTDESDQETQLLLITRAGSSVQLRIIAPRRMVLKNDLPAASENFKEQLLKKVALTLGSETASPQSFQTQIGAKQAEGVRLRAGRRSGEVVWLRWSLRLIGLALIRSDADESVSEQLWQTVSSSFKVDAVVLGVMREGEEPPPGTQIDGGVLNGKALELPKPAYPTIARAAHASGTVLVQVLIDEEGNVVSAHAVEGHPLLQAAAVAAARQARFTPTLLEGEPVKVTGVIQYNFVAQ